MVMLNLTTAASTARANAMIGEAMRGVDLPTAGGVAGIPLLELVEALL